MSTVLNQTAPPIDAGININDLGRGERYEPAREASLARHHVPAGTYLAGNDQKPTLAEQIRLARREVPAGEYHAPA